MKERIKIIVAIDLSFLLLLVLAGCISNVFVSETLHYSAFIVPILLGFVYIYTNKAQLDGDLRVLPTSATLTFALLTLMPTVAVTLGLSTVSGLLKNALVGKEAILPDEPFAIALLLHALFPALLEEMLFRYLPVRIIGKNTYAVLLSAVTFSLAHTDLFAIPHTLAAGILLGLVTVICNSPVPAIFIHFFNNASSLSITYFPSAAPTVISVIAVGALLSTVAAVIKRKALLSYIREIKSDISEHTPTPLIYIGVTIFIAITKLI